ncbi:MAG TPA: PKD domain-containing protein, partial [Phytomonospora sp.]
GRCNGATCTFDGGASTDAEGAIASYGWAFGDGTTGTGRTVGHAYPNVTKTYTVRLTVTDGKGQPGTATRTVRCTKVVSTPICFMGV